MNPTPKVNCSYGAPMGRQSRNWIDADSGRIYLRRIRLDSGGYDNGGAYWGIGAPLYWASDIDGNDIFLRAQSRDAAKRELREMFGQELRFFQ